MQNSGKLLILAILLLATVLAGASWWFRYSATHRAVEFWGPDETVLIRDAPKVTLFQMPSAETIRMAQDNAARAIFEDSAHDISQARGLLHLRNALLEDRNFTWPSPGQPWPTPPSDMAYWLLSFHDPQRRKTAIVMFTEDCRYASGQKKRLLAYEVTTISADPIAAGLREMFSELVAESAGESPATAR